MWRRRTDQWERFLLWVDAVGAYWTCTGNEIVLGQPGSPDEPDVSGPDIPIFANLSRHHARIIRDGEQYLIDPVRPVFVNRRPIVGLSPLKDGQTVQLGEALQLRFRMPNSLSLTACLDLLSGHRTQPSVRGILLMAGSCLLGPRSDCHVVCRDWPEQVILSYDGMKLLCRGPAGLVAGKQKAGAKGRAIELTNNVRVQAEGLSFGVESLMDAG